MIPDDLLVVLEQGLAVFPCRANEKRPLAEHGVKDASTDRARIKEWWRKFPECNWGCAMTEEIAAVDLDVKNGHDGRRALRELTTGRGQLPATLTNTTPSGGEHLLFNIGCALKNKAGVAPGVDIRSAGGYIIVPPSLIDGRAYAWRNRTAPIARAPDWFVKELQRLASARTSTPHESCAGAQDQTIPEGQRNDTLFRYACSLRGRNLSEAEAWAVLAAKNQHCVPPLDAVELTQILRSAWSYAPPEEMLLGIEPTVRELLNDLRDDEIVLANDYVPFPWAARRLYERMALQREAYVRGGAVVELVGGRRLELLTAAKLRSRIDAHGRHVKAVKVSDKTLVLAPKRCSASTAEALLVTQEADQYLPPIELVTNAPVLVESGAALITRGAGYHADNGGLLVLGRCDAVEVPFREAVSALTALLDDFLFATPADRARAMAGFIGPALRASGVLRGHALMNCVEADQSQTGKNYLVRLQQAVYGEVATATAKRSGGVGSLDEDIGARLLRGSMFVLIDNVRGRLNSEYLESVLTSDDEVTVRVPYRGQTYVSVRRITFQLTSNGVEATLDLANRMLITRLLRQPVGYQFTRSAEGGLLEHVKVRQPFYLGCVHTILRHWFAAGRPAIDTGHSFREWTGALDWIVQRVFELAPLLADHSEALARVSNPALGWLRAVALTVVAVGREGHGLSATAIVELCSEHGVEIPGARPDVPEEKLRMHVGSLLARCFGEAALLRLDAVSVRRWELRANDPRYPDRRVRRYQFWRGETPPPPAAPADPGVEL
jgi:hypothetical protein